MCMDHFSLKSDQSIQFHSGAALPSAKDRRTECHAASCTCVCVCVCVCVFSHLFFNLEGNPLIASPSPLAVGSQRE